MTATPAQAELGVSEEPTVLTVEEAAAILRISRNAAYAAAREWRDTDGASGIPCIVIGRTLRVPRSALTQLLAGRLPSRQAVGTPPG